MNGGRRRSPATSAGTRTVTGTTGTRHLARWQGPVPTLLGRLSAHPG